jgi:hypothetical protein
MSQLERNLQEDFAKDGVDSFAKGVWKRLQARVTL